MAGALAGRLFRKERKSSVLFTAGGFTPELVDDIQPPPSSSRFRVFYLTLGTSSHRGGSEWIDYPETTPRQWIERSLPSFKRVLSIVFDKE